VSDTLLFVADGHRIRIVPFAEMRQILPREPMSNEE
jgi:hypothetical protein